MVSDQALISITGMNIMFSAVLVIIFLLVCLGIVIVTCSKRKSKEYRELLADMYVVGMIKQFAQKDNIDLNEEMKAFAKIVRKTKLKYR